MNNEMNNNLDDTHDFKLLINCKEILAKIQFVSLALFAPSFVCFLIKGLEDSKNYGTYALESAVHMIFLYCMFELIKKGYKFPAVLLLILSLVSSTILLLAFNKLNTVNNSSLSLLILLASINALWSVGSMFYVLINKDIQAYYNYLNKKF